MVRQTSIDSYNAIKENGLLSRRRWQFYDILFKYGPLTGGEAFQYLKQHHGIAMPTNSNTTTRLGELRNLGVAVELGTKKCPVTGQNVILWDVTPGLPREYIRPRSAAWDLINKINNEVNPAFLGTEICEMIKRYLKK